MCAEVSKLHKARIRGVAMFGIETLEGPVRAVARVGLVLVEALALYVVYGGLTSIIGERITETVQST
jgi:hypothetical protein